MKHTQTLVCLLLVCLLLVCLLLTGCHRGGKATTAGNTNPSITEGTRGQPDIGIDVDFEVLGSRTVNHSVNISQVRYITAADQLPEYDELSKYDASWFKDHAMLLIFESVASGKVTVGIEKIQLDGSTANITLTHPMDGTVSIATTTTWMVWVEVERDLAYNWKIVNPALESNIVDR